MIKPFRGYRYNTQKVNTQDVITPPYDVINDELKKTLSARSPYNFVNVLINEDHSKANEFLNDFIKKEIIVRDDSESLYIYEQKYTINDSSYTRSGFISLLKIEEFGADVLPHEKVFDKYVNERYDLMENTRSDIGQIFFVYEDEKREIDGLFDKQKTGKADLFFTDDDGCEHRVWRVSDENTINGVVAVMKEKQILVADGHHRYTTAVKYNKEHPEKEYVMITLVNTFNEGLLILPTNRILNIQVNIDDFKDHFHIEKLPKLEIDLEPKSFIIANTEQSHKISLIDKQNNDLDIILLHGLIFKEILDLPDDKLKYPNIEFIKGNEETIRGIKEGKTAFFVNPPTLRETFAVSKSGNVLPQKSTFFYPKIFSGFVLNRWE